MFSYFKAVKDGGVPVIEILQRSVDSEKALELAVKEFPDITVGAGSVLNIEKCKRMLAKGAKFIVSPGFDEKLVKFCVKEKIPVIPGAVTPTEIQMAVNCGLTILKYFPLFQMGGIDMLKVVTGPFPSVKFIVTGGLEFKHLEKVMACDKVFAAGGVWMFCEEDSPTSKKKEYKDMVKIIKESVRLVERIRK
ncbi:MAG: bifunctional 4-hydroxy-2-oxoglutarate aldolase/2-dehydro-3-deoxy-phosphogluconate aldolase [Candidatus Humimicrobiaceae bacterium]